MRCHPKIVLLLISVASFLSVLFFFVPEQRKFNQLHNSAQKSFESEEQELENTPRNDITGGYWPSKRPYMDINRKVKPENFRNTKLSHIQLDMGTVGELHVPLKSILANLSEWKDQKNNAEFTNRDSVTRFKPGVLDIKLILSDIQGQKLYRFPYLERYKPVLQIVENVLGENMLDHVIRMQFARIGDGAVIKRHVDTGAWSTSTHRIHVPIIVPEETDFTVYLNGQKTKLELEEGRVFELNNRIPHEVSNAGLQPRVHLIIDVAEQARPKSDIHYLQPGQVCKFAGEVIC